jgi:rubrerythrin
MMNEDKKTPHTPIEILKEALRKEQSSYTFYNDMLQQSTVDFMSDILEELRDAEFHHMKMIEKKIAHLELG